VTRAFVAVRPPDSVLDEVAARTAGVELPAGGKWTTRNQWHITLQFLGNDADVDAVTSALDGIDIPVGSLDLSGAGTLPRERRSKYLVLFVYAGREWLRSVADAVAARLAPLGYERDGRDFDPHLTIARFKQRVALAGVCAAVGTEPFEQPWEVAEIGVYESRLGAGPAEYSLRGKIPLRRP
jgi:2'-5' RNA ligase